jgi:GDPmannose 4,6-dehydratase
VREFAESAARCAGFELAWEGEGPAERGRDRCSGRVLIEIDPRFYRPAEVDHLRGNASKAVRELGWKPKVHFEELVELMQRADLDALGV